MTREDIEEYVSEVLAHQIIRLLCYWEDQLKGITTTLSLALLAYGVSVFAGLSFGFLQVVGITFAIRLLLGAPVQFVDIPLSDEEKNLLIREQAEYDGPIMYAVHDED